MRRERGEKQGLGVKNWPVEFQSYMPKRPFQSITLATLQYEHRKSASPNKHLTEPHMRLGGTLRIDFASQQCVFCDS